MGPAEIPLRKQIETTAGQDSKAQPDTNIDPRHKALAVAIEFSKRLFEVRNLEDLYFVLTNDIRALIDFDRAFLIIHMEDKSKIVSVGNQPLLETNTKFYEVANKLALDVHDLRRGLFLSSKPGAEIPSDENVSQQARQGLQNYIEISECSYALCVPLLNRNVPVGHLVLDYFTAKPNQLEIITMLNIATFISAALVENWVISKRPEILELIDPNSREERKKRRKKRLLILVIALVAFVNIFFLIPFPFNVGGEAEVEPTQKQVAFCEIDGIVDRVSVTEGSHVKQGQIIATMDTRELDYKINSARSQFDIFTSEAELLKAAAYEDPSKLGDSHLVDLKRKSAWDEFAFYNWERRLLRIKAPATGIVLTKEIETLAGKKFKAGEPFCEIAIPSDLSVDLLLPQDRVSLVSIDQTMTVHFDSAPSTPYELTVKQISPLSETVPRLGSVYRVRAPFPNAPSSTLVGMKGVASIRVAELSLWSIISTRLSNLWRRYYLRIS
jgi:multidrug resistance efflux pump